MAVQKIGRFGADRWIIDLHNEGSTILMQCYLGICKGPFYLPKSHLLRICEINGFLVNGKDIKFCEIFFNGLLHVPCLGCEVKTDMSGQSNDCLKVCNVKMKKKKNTRAEMGHISENVGLQGVASNNLNFFWQNYSWPSVQLLWIHFGQNQLDLDGADGYIHGPCSTPCISANTAWNLSKMLLGIIIINYVN